MLTSLSSNAISAKARAIYGKRLTTANYKEILRLSSVSDVCAYLKNNTSYSKYLKGVNETSIHRGQLENLLGRTKIEKYFSLCKYVFSSNLGFYRYLIVHLEITIIQNAIISLNAGDSKHIISNLPAFMDEYTIFEFTEITQVKSFDDLLTVLEKTPYKSILKKYNAPNGEINLSECELALNLYYYKSLLGSIEKHFRGNTRAELIDIVKIEIELTNLSLICRLKHYFNKSSEDIKKELIPIYYRLSNKKIDQLLEQQDKKSYVRAMAFGKYTNITQEAEFNHIEEYTKRLKYKLNRKMMRFSSNAPISFFTLMTLTQIEIENITTIIEGVRYNVEKSEIEKLLILE